VAMATGALTVFSGLLWLIVGIRSTTDAGNHQSAVAE